MIGNQVCLFLSFILSLHDGLELVLQVGEEWHTLPGYLATGCRLSLLTAINTSDRSFLELEKVPLMDEHDNHGFLPRYKSIVRALHPYLFTKVQASKVLVVGAGGIGCELLKNLVMTGFADIEIVRAPFTAELSDNCDWHMQRALLADWFGYHRCK